MLQAVNNPINSATPMPGGARGFDLRDAIAFVRRRWLIILWPVAFSLLFAAIYVASLTPLYTARVQLILDPQASNFLSRDMIGVDTVLDAYAVENQMTIMSSTALLRRVVDKEHLLEDPEFGVRPRGTESGGFFSWVRKLFSRSEKGQETHPKPREDLAPGMLGMSPEMISTVERMKGAITVKRPPGQGLVIDITFTSADPKKAARLANAVADAYIVDKLDTRFEAAKRASSWLNDRLVELRGQLRVSEEAVARFRAENNLMQSSNATLSQEQLSQVNQRLAAARAETAEKKARFDLLQKSESTGGDLSALPDAMNSGLISSLREKKNELSQQLAELESRYTGAHPALVNARAQLADVQRSFAAEIKRQTANIRNEYELARARQASVEQTFREVTGETTLDASKAITLRELERAVAVNKSLFEDFLKRSHLTQEQSTFEARDARIITPALIPAGATSPRPLLIYLGALVAGLACGVGAAFAIELLNDGFTTARQVASALGLPTLASIAKIDALDLKLQDRTATIPELPFIKPMSRLSECFRMLRSAVHMSDVDNPPKVLQFTSSVPGEGKTTVALTTAASIAHSGLRPIIIEGDLRHPVMSRYFHAEKEMGLVEYLLGEAELQTVVRYDERIRVWYLPVGAPSQNPSDLLGSERMKKLVEHLRGQFDMVLIDTPPVGPVVDPLIVSKLVDKVVFVVRWNATNRDVVEQSVSSIPGYKKVAGVVLNQINEKKASKYGRYADPYYHEGNQYYRKYYHQ
jgi:succinoglycan biosynthesis transport protein ExoP